MLDILSRVIWGWIALALLALAVWAFVGMPLVALGVLPWPWVYGAMVFLALFAAVPVVTGLGALVVSELFYHW